MSPGCTCSMCLPLGRALLTQMSQMFSCQNLGQHLALLGCILNDVHGVISSQAIQCTNGQLVDGGVAWWHIT